MNTFSDDGSSDEDFRFHYNEGYPLLKPHFSMMKGEGDYYPATNPTPSHLNAAKKKLLCRFATFVAVVLTFAYSAILIKESHLNRNIVAIEHSEEYFLDIGNGLQIWYRTWGNKDDGIPVLFVHGGPGSAVADYYDGNKEFFDQHKYYAVEVDQRGTGKSQPSVRDDWRNMALYKDISIDLICEDFEKVREALGIEKWLIWGGSFGSTLSINYGTRYPECCLALIIRGIYLDTFPEMIEIYEAKFFEDNPHRMNEFNTLYDYASHNISDSEEALDRNDGERLLRVYERMIEAGDEYAIWHWHVFENNLMVTEPDELLDPRVIDPEHFGEARSLVFFETILWLRGAVDDPSNLLDRVDQLTSMPVWICQGRHDEVCPPKYARYFVDAMDDAEALFTAKFVNSGHPQSDPVMAKCLKESLYGFERDL